MKLLSDTDWDRKLGIDTSGGHNHQTDGENYPYEPTPYSVLQRLAESGYISGTNVLTDYGCDKGRCAIFLRAMTGCTTIGIDYDERLVRSACRNLEKTGLNRVSFVHARAENFDVPDQADTFFFFNPFSVVLLRAVIGQNSDYRRLCSVEDFSVE